MSTRVVIDPFKVGCLEAADLNSAFSKLSSAYNALCVKVDALIAPTAPDLTGYVTQSQLLGHAGAPCPHPGMIKMAGTNQCLLLQIKTGTIPASNNVTVTLTPAYPTSLVSAMVSGSSTIGATTPSQVTINGVAGEPYTLWTLGY
jgi:hypothetical protein